MTSRFRDRGGALLVATFTLVASLALPAAAGAAPAGPSTGAVPDPAAAAVRAGTGWTLTRVARGWELRWRGTTALPIGAERLTVRQDGVEIGTAREDGTDAVLVLAVPPPSLEGLELWRGNRRIDVTAPAAARRADQAGGVDSFFEEAAAPAPAASLPDPGRRGPYATARLTYELEGGFPWTEPTGYQYAAPIEVLGEVTAPRGAPPRLPLVLILHGRHATCFTGGAGGSDSGDWPCPPGWQPIPSYAGYRVTADLLASQGNMVVSISANGINGQDFASFDGGAGARSALIRHHLRLWADWSQRGTDPWGGRMRNAVDMNRVVLIGHSRGGEGVARATIDSRASDRWRIRGLTQIGPTAFGSQVPVAVPTLVILPYCDGDVSDLQGQAYVDGGRDLVVRDVALRTSLLVRGANHNFFNSEWTPGQAQAPAMDDWNYGGSDDDPTCGARGPNRLSPKSQQRVGATYASALVRLALSRDVAMRSYLDGEVGAPASADRAIVQVSALGGDRKVLHRPRDQFPTTTSGITAQRCAGFSVTGVNCSYAATQPFGATPHWVGVPTALDATQLVWSRSGSVRFDLGAPVDLRAFTRLDLRFALGGGTPRTDAQLRIIDINGRSATLRSFPRPSLKMAGSPGFTKLWARTLRGDLTGATGVDLRSITAVQLLLTGEGEAFVFDITARGQTLPLVDPRSVPVATVGSVTVAEGGPGARTATVPVTIDRRPAAPVSYWVLVNGELATEFRTVTFTPDGPTTIGVKIGYRGDSIPVGDRYFFVVAFAKTGGVTGSYLGGVTVREDDPPPKLRIDTTSLDAVEGSASILRVRLDRPVDYDQFVVVQFGAPLTGGPEVDSDDLPAATWREWSWGSDPPIPPVKLSEVFIYPQLLLDAGATSATLIIPWRADGVAEGPERVRLQVYSSFGPLVGAVEGTVTD
jgi:hypothetical protein